ncbi:ATP-binding protein [Microbacterium sp. BK668]|uniref:ATP-binding protein n=1 Tax=Microbacterium sp. BK668 TaxID=2512118 RepID=UPI0010E7F987|nr:ATP-binding protein [Microbacterium sp. BK668]TDN92241.1 putative kinase [Microbacterium sp. BK668]
MTTVVLLCGVAGAGKTTYARALEADGYVRVSYDEEMWMLGYDSIHVTPEALGEADRRVRNRLRAAIASGTPVVLDASLSTRAVRDELRAFVRDAGGEPVLVVVDAPLEALVDRVGRRRGSTGPNALHLDESALRRYHAAFEFPADDEPHTRVETG